MGHSKSRNGRSKVKHRNFFMLGREMILHCDEWKQLSSSAKVLYLILKAKYNGSNNAEIVLHYKELRSFNGFSSDATVRKAFKELEVGGWITKYSLGGLYRIPNKYGFTGKCDTYFNDRSLIPPGRYKESTHSVVQKPWPSNGDAIPPQISQPKTPPVDPPRTTESVATDAEKCS